MFGIFYERGRAMVNVEPWPGSRGDAVELFEDMLLVLFGNADAVVGDY